MATTRAALTDNDIRMLVKGATADERAITEVNTGIMVAPTARLRRST